MRLWIKFRTFALIIKVFNLIKKKQKMVNHKVNHKTIELINSLKNKEKIKILFVCLGNICRSSSAEEIMRTILKRAGLDRDITVDSAGLIGYHEGELPDSRMCMHAARRGYHLTHRSRPVRTSDFYDFDLIIGMDDRNIQELKDRAPGIDEERKIVRMTDFCHHKVADYVPDPYYGGASGFENVLDILEDACEGLLRHLSCIPISAKQPTEE